jgi:hypothetical protein
MATRDYFFVFGSGNPSTKSGLAPTFITFMSPTGVAGSAPSISEPGSKGVYKVSYDASATLMFFTLDGATTGLVTSDRYISGVFEGQDQIGVTLNALSASFAAFQNTAIALGTTAVAGYLGLSSPLMLAIGTTASSFGSTSVDPGSLFGFLRRAQEMAEGNQTYTKTSGILDFYSRGSSTLLREKTISDSTATTTKT